MRTYIHTSESDLCSCEATFNCLKAVAKKKQPHTQNKHKTKQKQQQKQQQQQQKQQKHSTTFEPTN